MFKLSFVFFGRKEISSFLCTTFVFLINIPFCLLLLKKGSTKMDTQCSKLLERKKLPHTRPNNKTHKAVLKKRRLGEKNKYTLVQINNPK